MIFLILICGGGSRIYDNMMIGMMTGMTMGMIAFCLNVCVMCNSDARSANYFLLFPLFLWSHSHLLWLLDGSYHLSLAVLIYKIEGHINADIWCRFMLCIVHCSQKITQFITPRFFLSRDHIQWSTVGGYIVSTNLIGWLNQCNAF